MHNETKKEQFTAFFKFMKPIYLFNRTREAIQGKPQMAIFNTNTRKPQPEPRWTVKRNLLKHIKERAIT